jgi:DNA repair protein SbcD/Mre11
MLLLHAADLHLGKTLHERDLGADQEAMLDRLVELIAERHPAALLLAGDLYDRSIPPPAAVRLFDSFLSRAALADPELVVVAIPGNHDSAARLSFGTRIMSRAGVHIRTEAADCERPIIVERGGERAAIWPLPFLGAGAFEDFPDNAPLPDEPSASPNVQPSPSAEAPQGELDFGASQSGLKGQASSGLRSQAELFAEAMRHIRPKLLRDARNVLVAHCFATGGLASESERGFVGQAEEVDSSLFEPFDYAALGHLHRFQKAGTKGCYSGSPLAYSFAEGGERKGFVLVELKTEGGFEAQLIPFKPLHAMRRIEGPFSVLAAPGAYPEYRDDFVEARLTDLRPVVNPADPLRANFPNLLSVRQAAFELEAARPSGASPGALSGDGALSILEEFAVFHAEMKEGSLPDEATAKLFEELAREAGHASL